VPGSTTTVGEAEGGGAAAEGGSSAAADEPVHVVLAASAAARYLAKRARQDGLELSSLPADASTSSSLSGPSSPDADGALPEGGGVSSRGRDDAEPREETAGQAALLRQSLQAAEWDLWNSIDSVWFLLSKLSSKRSLLLPDEVLQLQPPPPPGGWAHQYCMQQGSPAVATAEWSFDEAYPISRRAQRLSYVASSLMPGAPQQQILEIDGVAHRLRFLQSVFARHEMALRSLVALQEIEADGTLSSLDDLAP
jgi:hypothetical protein